MVGELPSTMPPVAGDRIEMLAGANACPAIQIREWPCVVEFIENDGCLEIIVLVDIDEGLRHVSWAINGMMDANRAVRLFTSMNAWR